jgi:hypothetical protein
VPGNINDPHQFILKFTAVMEGHFISTDVWTTAMLPLLPSHSASWWKFNCQNLCWEDAQAKFITHYADDSLGFWCFKNRIRLQSRNCQTESGDIAISTHCPCFGDLISFSVLLIIRATKKVTLFPGKSHLINQKKYSFSYLYLIFHIFAVVIWNHVMFDVH